MVGMGLGNIFSRMGAQGRSNSFLLNWSSANASQFKTAMAATKAGTSNTKILCLGDSTTYGLYGDATLTHMFGWPAQIAPLMSSYGYNGGWQNTFGNGTQTLPSTDTRFVQGSDWINNLNSMGGLAFKAAASAGSNGGNFSFTPSVSVDSFNFWAVKTATAGVIAYSIDGGSYTTLNCNGSNALLKQSVSAGALGTHTLNLKYSSGTQVWATAVEGYDSSTKEVSFWNAGYPGSTTGSWNDGGASPWSKLPSIANYNPDLTIIDLGINDWTTSVSTSTYSTNLQAIITAAKAAASGNGSVVLKSPVPSAISSTPLATQATYIAVMRALAVSNNIPFLDMWSRWGSYEAKNAQGFYFNTLHPNATGFADEAAFIASSLAKLAV